MHAALCAAKDFDEKIGINKLELFHLNDSKNKYGSRKDRHEHLTKEFIFGESTDYNGIDGLKLLLSKNNERNIPSLGEFSDGKGQDDIDLIRKIV